MSRSDLATPSSLSGRVQAALAPHLEERGEGVPALVDALLTEARDLGVTDLHLCSGSDGLAVQFRMDGDLFRVAAVPESLREPTLQRVKVLAGLVVYQQREPQDGRLDCEIDGKTLSLRVSFMPSLHGERCVVRFPDPSRSQFTCEQLGMSDDLLDAFLLLIDQPQGAVFLTGPASSGKTTTIHSALRWLVAKQGDRLNIMTVEDPIEAGIEGISQTQIDPGVGFDFPSALRAALRQDPNVIVVGEIRDQETAATAMQASLAGHLLIATVHAGSSVGVFTRLAHMGVERYLLATCVNGVVNQRLPRLNCSACAQERPLDEALAASLGLEGSIPVKESEGCEQCHGTGQRGRMGAFELLRVSAALREGVLNGATETDLIAIARSENQRSLRDDLLFKLRLGIIPPREVLRLLG